MDRRIIEYLIIITAIVILVYGCWSMFDYKYQNFEGQAVTDFMTMYYPSSSEYTVSEDTIEFRNPYDVYNMDVSKLSSSDAKIKNLLNHYNSFNRGSTDFKNESCYLLTVEFEDESGFKYHSIIIPYDSFNVDTLSFTRDTDVFLFEANNREFVVDSAFNSEGAL